MEVNTDRRSILKQAGGAIAAGVALSAVGDVLGSGSAHAATKPKPKAKPKPPPPPPPLLGTVTAPSIGLTKPVYMGIEDAALNIGVGHGSWSSQPGQDGHCMIFGHRTSHGGPFRKLNLFKIGDPITVGGLTYYVQKIEILPITKKPAIWGYPGTGPRLSLVACSKKNGQPTSLQWRICVRAKA